MRIEVTLNNPITTVSGGQYDDVKDYNITTNGLLIVYLNDGRTIAFADGVWRTVATLREEGFEPVSQQIQRLGDFLVKRYPNEARIGEKVVDSVIRVLTQQRARIECLTDHLHRSF